MDRTQQLSIRFWGVRGSYPTPGPATVHYGGNTPCIELQVGDQTLILDAGTGIIGLGHQLIREKRTQHVLVAISHFHPDHIQGLPFFAPLYGSPTALTFIGPGIGAESLENVLWHTMHPPFFPVAFPAVDRQPQVHTLRSPMTLQMPIAGTQEPILRPRQDGEQATDDPAILTLDVQPSAAHSDQTLLYRITWGGWRIVYATDVEGDAAMNPQVVEFAHGADILIHDAQYTDERYYGHEPGQMATQGWGHSTLAMACNVAQTAQVGELILFHHDPSDDDIQLAAREIAAQACFPATRAAYEGLEITLTARCPQTSESIKTPTQLQG